MRSQTTMNVAAYSLLGAAAAVALVLPQSIGPQSVQAVPSGGPPRIEIAGVARDFKKGHPDFGVSISGGSGHYAGNVMTDLTSSNRPTFVGVIGGPVNAFDISNGATMPDVTYAPMVTVLGSAVTYNGQYDCPVTVRVRVGNQTLTPYGDFSKALAGNVNKSGNPRKYVHPATVAADTPISIDGQVWTKKQSSYNGTQESHWQIYSTFSSRPSTSNVKVLRNGDNVPTAPGFLGQLSVRSFLGSFINGTSKKITLKPNQSIYLFEFGSTSSSAADWQDLVVLVTLGETTNYLNTLDANGNTTTSSTPKGYKVQSQWRDGAGNPMPPHLMGTATGDVAGTKGSASTGGLYSAQSYDQWFSDVMGTNLATQHSIILTKQNDVWEYSTDAFYPLDGMLLGNESKPHNYYFTYTFNIPFMHRAGEHRFVEFQGDDDCWVFIDGKLAMDLGGIRPNTRQYLDVDRLGLSDGAEHRLDFFYAQRNESFANFRLRTSLDLGEGLQDPVAVTIAAD